MNRIAVGLACLALAGCGGGTPLLHPARTLPRGDVRLATGVSANAAVGSLADDLKTARDIAARDSQAPGEPGTNPAYAKGALVAAAVAPGLAPFIAGRVGIGNAFEGGIGYTGRAARIDVRRSFELSGPSPDESSIVTPERRGSVSLSVGVGGSAVLYGRQDRGELPNVDIQGLSGYGLDVPVLVGWQSAGGIYMVWGGVRGAFERVSVQALRSEPQPTPTTPQLTLDATRFYGGGVVGLATGFRHVHVGLEFSAGYQSVNGTYNANDVTVRGLTLAPATALWWTF